MGHQPNDHAGILYVLDSLGRTLEGLEHRANDLTRQVAQLTAERDALRAELAAVVRTAGSATSDVPPVGDSAPDDGAHDPPPTPPT